MRRIASGALAVILTFAVRASADDGPWRDWRGIAGDVAGRGVVDRGEAIWNDYLFDDYGANIDTFESGNPDYAFVLTGAHVRPDDPARPVIAPSQHHNRFRHTGDFGYPAADPLADPHGYVNVADLAEVRVAASADDVFFRFALTALVADGPTVVGVAIDTDPGHETGGGPWPFGAGLHRAAGWDVFLTVRADGGALTTAAGSTEDLAAVGGAVRADFDENVLEARIPRSALPGGTLWRLVSGAGRWDAASGVWAEPLPATTQGGSPGSLLLAPRIYDLAFNQHEPNSVWDETAQANALAAHRVDDHGWLVDVAALEAGASVPVPCSTGPQKETQRASLELGEGLLAHEHSANVNYDYLWKVQPYSVILPSTYCDPDSPAPSLDLFFHPGNSNHNVWLAGVEGAHARNTWILDEPLGYAHVQDVADRLNRIVATGLSLGEGWNYGERPGEESADLDTFLAATTRHHHDPERVRAVGMSRGAQGVFWFGQTFPDLVSHVVSYSGAWVRGAVENLRNTPVVNVHGDAFLDAGGVETYQALTDAVDALGYQHLHLVYVGRGHDFNLVDESRPIVEAWTSSPRIEGARITYTIDPADQRLGIPLFPGAGFVTDATLADLAAAGRIDLTSLARADALPVRELRFTGAFVNLGRGDRIELAGLSYENEASVRARMPDQVQAGWSEESLAFEETTLPPVPVANGLAGSLAGLAAVTIDLDRAGIDAGAPVDLSGISVDREVDVTLTSAGGSTLVTLFPAP